MIAILPVESFPALATLPGLIHGFTGRVLDIDVRTDRSAALLRLSETHSRIRSDLGLDGHALVTAEQVHGADVAIVDRRCGVVPAVDGLITADAAVCLGIHVADCGAVFIVDPTRRVIALVHSGRKGTELGITSAAIRAMRERYGCDPADMVVQLSPCIRPPHYETDFAAAILRQAREAGVREVHDCGICTAANLERYYSYRLEKGRTGRMLALLALA